VIVSVIAHSRRVISSCGSVSVGFCFLAVAELVSIKSKVGKPTQKKDSGQAKNPMFFYVVNDIFHDL
jgi:hypothetical protein